MKYLTGILAMGCPCELDSCGLWNLGKSDFTSEEKFLLVESEDMPFKDFGIEKNKLVPYRDYTVYNVANHVRAYVDMLYLHKFEGMHDLFADAINERKCRLSIFECVYRCRHLAQYRKMNEFMCEEFGNAWVSYKDAVEKAAESLEAASEEYNKLISGNNTMGVARDDIRQKIKNAVSN